MVALPNSATRGEECQSAREREGPQIENGASEELQMVREWSGEGSAESSGHQTERVGSSESRARVMGGGKKRRASQESPQSS